MYIRTHTAFIKEDGKTNYHIQLFFNPFQSTEFLAGRSRSTKAFMVSRLREEQAVVVVAGDNWNEANEEAVKAAEDEGTFLVHPFDQVGADLCDPCLVCAGDDLGRPRQSGGGAGDPAGGQRAGGDPYLVRRYI